MTDKRKLASELLPLLAATFPHTFFADPKRVKPLKINIHRDLNDWRKAQALPAAIGLIPLRRFMHWYTQRRYWWRIRYCQSVIPKTVVV